MDDEIKAFFARLGSQKMPSKTVIDGQTESNGSSVASQRVESESGAAQGVVKNGLPTELIADTARIEGERSALPGRRTGTVTSYDLVNRRGVIKRNDVDQKIRVHQRGIKGPGLPLLIEGERVTFDVEERGGEAVNVSRRGNRHLGVVTSFDFDKGHGKIKPEGVDADVFLHYKNVLTTGKGMVDLEEGEVVEFEVESADSRDEERRAQRLDRAIRVLRLDPRPALEKFALLDDFDEHLAHLGGKDGHEGLAQKENWKYRHIKTTDEYPILRGYIYNTFARLAYEGKVDTETDTNGRRIACFNTGLVTRRQENIFGYFEEARPPKADPLERFRPSPMWVFKGFFKRADRRMANFGKPPDIADYFENLEAPEDPPRDPRALPRDPRIELVYNLKVDLVPDLDHILLRKDRFPEKFRTLDELMFASFLKQKIEEAKERIRRNYKTAIPQFYRGRLQLLLPLCLEEPDRADLALVVSRKGKVYDASTVLPLDWAINNARLIARPDREWLDP